MALQQIAIKEQLVKTVVKSGNGGAVWVPKDWLGQEVIIILPQKQKLSLQEQILSLLKPYLKDILSISFYGSYARKEATKESDIDVLVITKEKHFAILDPNGKIEFLILPLHKIKEAIERYPAVYYQIIQEAEPLINSSLLEELRNIPLHKKSILAYLQETKEHLQSNKEFIELDKLDGDYITSFSVLYSLFLRLRALFILKCLLSHRSFSNKNFKKWLIENTISSQEFELFYESYRRIRNDKNTSHIKIKINTVEKIITLLEQEIKRLEERL